MKIKIDLKIFLLAFIFILTKQIHIYMLIMIFALIHELGHIMIGILLGFKLEKIEIIPVGIAISFNINFDDFNKKIGKSNLLELKKILIALAGPLVNIIIIIMTLYLKIGIIKKLNIIYANILIGIFNLLPIYPLDGGRILKGILNILIGRKNTLKYIDKISIMVLILISIISVYILKYNRNIGLIFVTIYLWIIVIKKVKLHKQKYKIYKILEENY